MEQGTFHMNIVFCSFGQLDKSDVGEKRESRVAKVFVSLLVCASLSGIERINRRFQGFFFVKSHGGNTTKFGSRTFRRLADMKFLRYGFVTFGSYHCGYLSSNRASSAHKHARRPFSLSRDSLCCGKEKMGSREGFILPPRSLETLKKRNRSSMSARCILNSNRHV